MSALRNLAPAVAATGSDLIAPDCRGLNFWKIDRALRDLLTLYLDETALRHFTPHFERLGELAGGRLDELALQADKHHAGPASSRPLRPRRRLGGISPGLSRNGAYRLRRVRPARDVAADRRARLARHRTAARQICAAVSVRSGRVRTAVSAVGQRQLDPTDPEVWR